MPAGLLAAVGGTWVEAGVALPEISVLKGNAKDIHVGIAEHFRNADIEEKHKSISKHNMTVMSSFPGLQSHQVGNTWKLEW